MKALSVTLVVAPLWVAACASAPEDKPTAEPELLTYDAEKVDHSLGQATFTFPWLLKNPTGSKVSVGKVSYDLELEDRPERIKGEVVLDADVPAGGESKGSFNVSIPFATTDEAFAQRAQKPALRFWVTATFAIAGPKGEEAYIGEYHGEVFGPQKPKVTMRAEAARYEDVQYDLSFQVKINNPNPFPIPLEGLQYQLEVMGEQLSEGELASGVEMAPASELVFDIERNVGKDEHQELAKKLKGAQAIPYALKGTLKTQDGLTVNAPVTGELEFSSTSSSAP